MHLTDADHSNLGAVLDVVVSERCVHSDSRAEDRSGAGRVQVIRNWYDEVGVGTVVQRIPTFRDVPVGQLGAVRADESLLAVRLLTVLAVLAFSTAEGLRAHADTHADAEVLDLRTHFRHVPNNLEYVYIYISA